MLPDAFKRLKPLFGVRIDRLWIEYGGLSAAVGYVPMAGYRERDGKHGTGANMATAQGERTAGTACGTLTSASTQDKTLMDVIARRTSCRAYKPDPVPERDILQILEAARLAPSACNQQPWRFAVVRDPEARRQIVEAGFLPGLKMRWARRRRRSTC